MAGTNLVLKKGQVVFKEGDASDGMYVVRKGELLVYLERDGNVVSLAKIAAGGMIGEMAFFDNKPRSASVRAEADCEVSKISNKDFSALMKQIPKWFVGIMSGLSGRLRDTNARLQNLEAEQKGHKGRYETVLKLLHVLSLLWSKHGVKSGKDFVLSRKDADEGLQAIFKWDPKELKKFYEILAEAKVILIKNDNYKNMVFALANRASLSQLVEVIEEFIQDYPELTAFPEPAVDMLDVLAGLMEKESYDTSTIEISRLSACGQEKGLDTAEWTTHLALFSKQKPFLALTKTSTGELGLRAGKKDIARYASQMRILSKLKVAGLDR